MAKITTLFIDKGGVLVDNTVLGAQYRRLLGEFLPTALGGTSAPWARANMTAFDRQVERWRDAGASPPPITIREWFANDARNWLYDMCDVVRITRPSPSEADRIAADSLRYVREHLEIDVPRIVERLRGLCARGLTLHLASGDASEDVDQYLRRIGARELFDRAYGSDLVNAWKTSVDFYSRIIAQTGVDPKNAVVIDDSPRAVSRAAECGLRGVLVMRGEGESFEAAVQRAFDEVDALL